MRGCAIAAAALGQLAVYTGAYSYYILRRGGDSTRWINVIFLVFVPAVLLGIFLIPKAHAFFHRSQRENPGRRPVAAAALPLVAALALAAAARLPAYNAWDYGLLRSCAATIGYGFVSAGSLMAFFVAIPPGRRGFWFGVVLSAGFVWWRVLQSLTHNITDEAMAEMWYNRIFTLQAATILLMAALTGFGLLKLPPATTVTPVSKSILANNGANSGAKTLALTLFLFYLANGFAGVQLSPGVPAQNINQGFWQLHFLVVIACPLFGLYIDRRRNGARTLLFVSSVLLILAPTLNVLSGSPILHSLLLTLGALTQFAVLVAATAAVARLGSGLAWYGVAFLVPVVLRLVTHFAYTASVEMPALGGGTSSLLAIVAAVGCNIAARRMPDGDASGQEGARAGAESFVSERSVPEPEPVSLNVADSVGELCRRHNLSPREADVLRLLAEGCGASAIAAQLGISEHTAKTHLRNIMAKSEVSSQKALLVKILQGA